MSEMKLKILEQAAPIIKGNFDEVKANLEERLAKYTGMEVTAETLEEAKTAQRELASMRKDIDGLRLDVKREITKPIDEFDRKMKVLFGLVTECEGPIKEGIKVFDDKERAERKAEIDKAVEQAIAGSGLQERFAERFEFDPRWLNKTATKSEIAEGINRKVDELKAMQEVFEQTKAAIEQHVQQMNTAYKLASPLDAEPYIKQVTEKGWQLTQVIANIGTAASKQAEAEKAAVEQAEQKKEQLAEEPPKVQAGANQQAAGPATRTVTIRVTSTNEKLQALAQYLKASNIAYEKIDG